MSDTGYNDGAYGEGPYGIGAEYEEFVEDGVLDIMPDILALDPSAILRRYIDAHDEQLVEVDNDFATIIASRQINNAEDIELDRIGRLFGSLGRRRGRDDSSYRSYLKSIVQSFDGRGTNPGIKFAISGAIQASPDDITIEEDFIDLADTIILEDWESHKTQTVFDIFDLAKPSCVELNEVGKYELYGANADASIEVTPGNKQEGLGSGTIGDNEIGFYD